MFEEGGGAEVEEGVTNSIHTLSAAFSVLPVRGTVDAAVAASPKTEFFNKMVILRPTSVRAWRSLLPTRIEAASVAAVVRDVTLPTFCADDRLARAGLRAVRAGATEKAEAEATRQTAGRIL